MEEQLENTVLDWPSSDLETVKEAEQSGGRLSRGRMRRTRLVWPGETRHLHSPPVWSTQLALTVSQSASQQDTHREVARIVGGLHDPDPLLGVEGAGVALAEVQAGGPGPVRGGVGRAGPAGGLAPLWLVGAGRALLAVPAVAVVHVAGLTGN